MADELDSGSSVGNYVWVQVPSPAFTNKKNPLFFKDSFLLFISIFVHHITNRLFPALFHRYYLRKISRFIHIESFIR